MGVPTHPILVHFAVVLIPILAILSVAYAFFPRVRPKTRWAVGLLAVVVPIATLFVKLSGDMLLRRLQDRKEVTPDFMPRLVDHQSLGTFTFYLSVVLGIVALVLIFVLKPGAEASSGVTIVLRVLTVLAAVAAIYYVVRTGDTGGKNAWSGK
jgi:uncharacterized membrane protein